MLLGLGSFGGFFALKELDKEEAKLDEIIQNYSDTAEQLKSFEEIKKTYDSYQGDREKLQNMVVSKKNTLGLIQELEDAAKVSGVILKTSVGEKPLQRKTVSKIDPSKDQNKEEPLWLQAELLGDFQGITKFVKYVENGSFMVNIASFKIIQSKTSTPENMLENKDGTLGNLSATFLISNEF